MWFKNVFGRKSKKNKEYPKDKLIFPEYKPIVKKITRDDEGFFKDYKRSEELHIPYRNFVLPEYVHVRLGNLADPRSVNIGNLFFHLGMSEENVKEVFEFDNERNRYSGRFTENGKQHLADMLGKEITYQWYTIYGIGGEIIPGEPEVYKPQKQTN